MLFDCIDRFMLPLCLHDFTPQISYGSFWFWCLCHARCCYLSCKKFCWEISTFLLLYPPVFLTLFVYIYTASLACLRFVFDLFSKCYICDCNNSVIFGCSVGSLEYSGRMLNLLIWLRLTR